ncbi:MAG TPA: hypothetical protein VF376_11285, partial [Thermoanaerobaculia bacterium]
MDKLEETRNIEPARSHRWALVGLAVSWALLFALLLIEAPACRRKPPEADEGDGITRRGDGSLALAESSPLRKQLVVEAI